MYLVQLPVESGEGVPELADIFAAYLIEQEPLPKLIIVVDIMVIGFAFEDAYIEMVTHEWFVIGLQLLYPLQHLGL